MSMISYDSESIGRWYLTLEFRNKKPFRILLLTEEGLVEYCRLISSYKTYCKICMYPCVQTNECRNHFYGENKVLSATFAVGIYHRADDKIQNILSEHIRQLKNYREYSKPIACAMILCLRNNVFSLKPEDIDFIIPIPLHSQEFKIDGDTGEQFNQAELLAEYISEEFHAKCLKNLIIKKSPLKMRGLKREERLRYARQVYDLNEFVCQELEDELRNSTILLIDDVRTTGATGLACAEILKKKIRTVKVYLFVAGRAVFPETVCK